jgi:hypothetical protein
MRRMEQKIDDAGLSRATGQKPVEEFCRFRPDAGQVAVSAKRGLRRNERIECR